jgi:hypothetical protein
MKTGVTIGATDGPRSTVQSSPGGHWDAMTGSSVIIDQSVICGVMA